MANRRLLHRRVGIALETVHAANLDAVSGQIAVHYERGGTIPEAIRYYQRAGDVERQLFANKEAIRLYEKGLALLETLPNSSERAEQELALQLPLSVTYRITKGYAAAEVGHSLGRARALCQQLGKTEMLGSVLWGLYAFNFVRSNLHEGLKLGQELLSIAQKLQNPTLSQQAQHALGTSLSSMGALEQGLEHLEQAVALDDAGQRHALVNLVGLDLGLFCRVWSAQIMWHLGYLDRSLQRTRDVLALVESLDHPYSRALAMAYATMTFQFSRNSRLAQKWAEATIKLCAEQGLGYYDSWATILLGWALAEQGLVAEGISRMHEGLAGFRATDTEARFPYYLALLAEAYGKNNQIDEGLKQLAEALAIAEKNSDHWHTAEVYRLMGELRLRSGETTEGEACFHKALEISRRQKAKIPELRATMSLARLWAQQSQQDKAREMLADIVDWFTEGANTVDLKEARDLLKELS
jgi:predicted ATPase